MIRSYATIVREEPFPILFGVCCAFLSGPGQTYFISLFMGDVGAELGFGATDLGFLYLLATLGSAALLPLTGHWIDRVDLRLYIALVATGLGIACGIMAGAGGAIGLFFAFLLLRLAGQGLMTHTGATSVARYFDRHRGRALSLVAMGFPLAEAAMPALAVAMIATAGWRATYAIIGVTVVAIAAPVLLWLVWRNTAFTRPPGQSSGTHARALDGMKIVIATRFFWCALPALLFMPFGSTALIFHIQAIAAAKSWSTEIVALGYSGYAIGHAVGLLLSGGFIDRFGARNMLAAMNMPMLAGVAVLGLYDSTLSLFVFLGTMGLSSGFVQTTGSAVWAEVYGIARLGTIRSFAVMLMVTGTALGPATLGLLLDTGVGIGSVCASLVVLGIAAALLAFAGRKSRPDSRPSLI